jgi:hypothetical protein
MILGLEECTLKKPYQTIFKKRTCKMDRTHPLLAANIKVEVQLKAWRKRSKLVERDR